MEFAKPKCLICQKLIEVDENNFFDGGDVVISFGYGSRHDQCGIPDPTNDMEKMLNCNKIYARMCDDCWEKVFPLCEGHMVTTEQREERVV